MSNRSSLLCKFSVPGWVISLLLAALCLPGQAQEPVDSAGTVKTSVGSASVIRGKERIAATVGLRIWVSDRVLTGADGAIGITLRDNTLLSAGPNSTLDIRKFSFDTTTNVGQIDAAVRRGTLSVISGKIAKTSPERVSFSAPGMALAVRGTEFVIDAGDGPELPDDAPVAGR